MGKIGRVRALIVLSTCSLSLAGCVLESRTASGSGVHNLGDTFVAGVRMQQKIGPELLLSFEEVLADSRCPKSVTCVWQGAARVKLKALAPGGSPAPHVVELATAPESERAIDYHGYRIELLDVEPHPDVAAHAAPMEYTVSLRVTRAR